MVVDRSTTRPDSQYSVGVVRPQPLPTDSAPERPAHSGTVTRIEADQEINAPTNLTWNAVKDFGSYDDWNPVFLHIDGARSPGRTGSVTVRDRAHDLAKTEVRLLFSKPPVALAWRWSIPGLSGFSPEQYFYIDSRPGDLSHVYLGTSFCGPFSSALAVGIRHMIEPLLQDMCLALKARVEHAARLLDHHSAGRVG